MPLWYGLGTGDTRASDAFAEALTRGRPSTEAPETIEPAEAYADDGVILSAGFAVCALSDFAPISRFGALSATAIVLAVLGDLFLLPALLSLTPRSTLGRWR